jgi:putative ABC transport system permease protein
MGAVEARVTSPYFFAFQRDGTRGSHYQNFFVLCFARQSDFSHIGTPPTYCPPGNATHPFLPTVAFGPAGAAFPHNLRLLPIAWFIRAPADSEALGRAIQKELEHSSGDLPTGPIRSMDQVSSRSTARAQFETLLMVLLGGSALLLAAVGVYGLMAYSVQQRTREIGIRIALGASHTRDRNTVILQGIRVVLMGIAFGLGAAFGLSRLLATFLFGVQPHDPIVFITVPLFLSVIIVFSVWLPARRATRVNPVDALRCE